MKLIVIIFLLPFCGCLDEEHQIVSLLKSLKNMQTSVVQMLKPTSIHKSFDPNVHLFTTHLIRKAGYSAEAHSIMTEDGYLLTLHRIPGSIGSPPVLLQHGLLASSLEWIVLGKGKALAYLLADAGYDVWLGNFRGNTYSKAHISLSPWEAKFWNFSFHEMGIYDLPAMITYITNITNKPLHTYIGHSMGASNFYIMASEHPEIAQKVQRMISLAPAVFLNNMQSSIKYVVPFLSMNFVKEFFKEWYNDEFVYANFMFWCDLVEYCSRIMVRMWGYDNEQFNHTLLHTIFNNNNDPASTSIKTLTHFAQIIESGKFHKYDYGSETNLKIYKSSEPQEYNLRNIMVPIALYYSFNDLLINEQDMRRLVDLIKPNLVDRYEIPSHTKFSHMAYMLAEDAPQLLYQKILKDMKEKFYQNYGFNRAYQ